MVSSTRTGRGLTIVARPDRSASWRANLLLLAALSVPCLAIAIAFTLRGAWPILPLAGAELAALAATLYYVNRKLQYRQVITVSGDSVRIDKGYTTPTQRWHMPRHDTALAITPGDHPWEGPALALHDRHASVTLGEFLNREDSAKLLALLRDEFRIGAYGPRTQREF